jgi:hypothetical protein
VSHTERTEIERGGELAHDQPCIFAKQKKAVNTDRPDSLVIHLLHLSRPKEESVFLDQ